jgi:hypothetical protein
MKSKKNFEIIIQAMLFFIPLNVYIIGDWLGTGIQWIFFRYQQTYIGTSNIFVNRDIEFVLSGIITGKSAFSLILGALGAAFVLISFFLILINYRISVSSNKYPGILLILGGLSFLAADLLQYGVLLHGPVGICIPIGLPCLIIYGWWIASTTEQKDSFSHVYPITTFVRKNKIIIIFLCIFLIYCTVTGLRQSGDTTPAVLLPYSILDHQTISYDNYDYLFKNDPNNSYAFSTINGHDYSIFPIVTPILVLPIYVIQHVLLSLMSIPVTFNIMPLTSRVIAALVAALSCVVLYLSLKDLVSERTSLISTIIFAFATSTWSISSQALWEHGMGELLLILMIYVIIQNEKSVSIHNIVLLGMLSGLFVFNRPPDAFLIIPIFLYVFYSFRERIYYYFISGIISGLPFLFYNYLIFGNVLGGYIQLLTRFNFDWQFIFNCGGLLISPNKGLFVYSPILILAIVGYLKICTTVKNRHIEKTLKLFGLAIILEILLFSFYNALGGGFDYGPRYLTDMLPVLVIFCAIFFESLAHAQWSLIKKRFANIAIIILVTISIIIQIIGAFYFPYLDVETHSFPQPWDMNDSLIIHSYKDGSRSITGVSVLMIPPLPPLFKYSINKQYTVYNTTNYTDIDAIESKTLLSSNMSTLK